MKKRNKFNGFSVIELLVATAIIVIILGIVIFNVGLEKQNSALLRSSQTLLLNLRRAQNFALSSKVFRTGKVPCGWGIHFNGVGSTNYIIFADLAANLSCSDRDFIMAADGSENFETINLEAGIKVNALSNGLSDIVFTPPDPTVTINPDQAAASITLINRNFNSRTININKAGTIY